MRYLSVVLGCLLLVACGRSTKGAPPSMGEGGESGQAAGGMPTGQPSGGGGGTPFVVPGGSSSNGGQGGSSAPSTCAEGARFCVQENVFVCTADQQLELLQTCATGHCESTELGAAECAGKPCQPGSTTCQNNVLFTCGADAKLPELGTACGDDICYQGECRPKLCTNGQKLCVDNDVVLCIAEGAATAGFESCPEATRCVESGDDAHCEQRACTPGALVCLDEQLGTCADDGFMLAEVAEDCAGQAELCDLAGEQCSPVLVDALAGIAFDNTCDTGTVYGNVVAVDVPRTLTKLEFKLDVEAASDVVWLIYAFDGQAYTLEFEQPAHLQPGSGYVGSTLLDVQLEGATNYFFAFYTGNLVGSCYSIPSPSTRQLSLGGAVGGTGVGGIDYHESYLYETTTPLYDFRLTTAPPAP